MLHVGIGIGRPRAPVPGQGVVGLAAVGVKVVVVRRRVLLGVVAAQRVDRDSGPEGAAALGLVLVLVVLLEAEPPAKGQVLRRKSLDLFFI